MNRKTIFPITFFKSKRVILIIALLVLLILTQLRYVELVSDGTTIPLPPKNEFIINVINFLFTSVTICLIAITLWVQHKEAKAVKKQVDLSESFAKRDYDAQVLAILEKFIGGSYAENRRACWVLISNIHKPETVANMYGMFVAEALNYYGKTPDDFMETPGYKQYASFIRIIRVFELMSVYELSKETSSAIHFYYIYYRKLFIIMTKIYEDVFSRNDIKKHISIKHRWVNLIPDLDKIMSFHKLPLENNDEEIDNEFNPIIKTIASNFNRDIFFNKATVTNYQ